MSYIIKSTGCDRETYLVDIGPPNGNVTWSANQRDARRFESKEDAAAHDKSGFFNANNALIANGIARILRLIPRKGK